MGVCSSTKLQPIYIPPTSGGSSREGLGVTYVKYDAFQTQRPDSNASGDNRLNQTSPEIWAETERVIKTPRWNRPNALPGIASVQPFSTDCTPEVAREKCNRQKLSPIRPKSPRKLVKEDKKTAYAADLTGENIRLPSPPCPPSKNNLLHENSDEEMPLFETKPLLPRQQECKFNFNCSCVKCIGLRDELYEMREALKWWKRKYGANSLPSHGPPILSDAWAQVTIIKPEKPKKKASKKKKSKRAADTPDPDSDFSTGMSDTEYRAALSEEMNKLPNRLPKIVSNKSYTVLNENPSMHTNIGGINEKEDQDTAAYLKSVIEMIQKDSDMHQKSKMAANSSHNRCCTPTVSSASSFKGGVVSLGQTMKIKDHLPGMSFDQLETMEETTGKKQHPRAGFFSTSPDPDVNVDLLIQDLSDSNLEFML